MTVAVRSLPPHSEKKSYCARTQTQTCIKARRENRTDHLHSRRSPQCHRAVSNLGVHIICVVVLCRIENLDLLGEHGPMAWRMYNSYVEGAHAGVKRDLEATKAEIEAVNKKRKLAQQQGGGKLRELEWQWDEISRKNIQIDAAVQGLDKEIEKLRKPAA